MSALSSDLLPYLAAAAAAVVALVVTYLGGKSNGAANERAKAAGKAIAAKDEQLEMHREATDAERRTASMTDEQARKEALRWARR